MQKNEDKWPIVATKYQELLEDGPISDWGQNNRIPPIVINSQYIPTDLTNNNVTTNTLPNVYTGTADYPDELNPGDYVKTSEWTYRKEAKIRDKWMKVRVRYSGKNLAIIHSVITLYNRSYS